MISDAHTDFITALKSTKEKEGYLNKIKRQRVDKVIAAVFTSQNNYTLNHIKQYKLEIEYLKTKCGVDLVFAVEDLGFITQDKIKDFVILKPFSTTLTWNFKNKFAGGAKSDSGLTNYGRAIIKELEENNIFIDTAHLNRKSFNEFVKITTKPIFNSHSNIYALHKHHRNLTDNQIKKIVDSNGFLGLTIYDEFVAGRDVTSLDIANQIEYLINKFGSNNFGFGTDFYGIDNSHLPKDVKTYKELERKITYHLKTKGFSKEIIDKIKYKNLNRFLQQKNWDLAQLY